MLKLNKYITYYSFFIGILILSFSPEAKAQFFDGGVLAGIAATQIDGDRIAGYDKANLKLGMFIERKLKKRRRRRGGKKWNYGGEIYYIGKGSSTKAKTAVNSALVIQLHYIECSPYALYEFQKNTSIQGGISIATLLSNTITEGLNEWSSDEFNNLDLNYFIGIKYYLSKHFAIDARAQRSLTPFATVDTNKPAYNEPGLRNILLSFNAYYKL